MFPNICLLAQVIPITKNDSRLFCTNYRPISLLSIDYSTNNALITIVERIQKQLDNGNHTAGIFVDLKKAFDTVDHNILLEKLDYYGIRGVAKDWFCSSLDNRKQYVTLNGSNPSIKILTGVLQGSILGPLLFLNLYQ